MVRRCSKNFLRIEMMPTLGDYHNDPDLKAFILAEYVYDPKYGRVGRRGRKMVRRKPKCKVGKRMKDGGRVRRERNTKVQWDKAATGSVTIPTARLIWLLVYGDWPEGKVSFMNGDSMDLMVENLMFAVGSA